MRNNIFKYCVNAWIECVFVLYFNCSILILTKLNWKHSFILQCTNYSGYDFTRGELWKKQYFVNFNQSRLQISTFFHLNEDKVGDLSTMKDRFIHITAPQIGSKLLNITWILYKKTFWAFSTTAILVKYSRYFIILSFLFRLWTYLQWELYTSYNLHYKWKSNLHIWH